MGYRKLSEEEKLRISQIRLCRKVLRNQGIEALYEVGVRSMGLSEDLYTKLESANINKFGDLVFSNTVDILKVLDGDYQNYKMIKKTLQMFGLGFNTLSTNRSEDMTTARVVRSASNDIMETAENLEKSEK